MKTGAISDYADAHPIRSMKYSASPVVPVAVAPKNLADLPKLFDGHKKLSKSDPLVVCIIEETGENIVVRCGELYVEICPNDLEKDFAQCELIKSDPVVTYKETVTAKTGQSCLTKSQNKHNIIYASGEPLVEGLQETIEKGGITPDDNVKTRAKRLYEEFEWEKDDALKIWGVSDLTTRPNVVVIMSKTVQYMNEIKDSMVSAWQGATKNGVLTEENRIGFRVDVIDCELHADATQRGRGQILPWARRLFYACELSSVPILYEPIFLCEITAPMEATGGMYLILNQRRGQVLDSKQIPAPLNLMKAYLPVSESFGFTGSLRGATQGKAFPQCVFHHWELLKDLPLDTESKAEALVKAVRKRQGLKEETPKLEKYIDKL